MTAVYQKVGTNHRMLPYEFSVSSVFTSPFKPIHGLIMSCNPAAPLRVLDKAPVYNLDNLKDDSAIRLKELLLKNHTLHAVLRDPRLLFHNHMPHALGSSFLLGASSSKLTEIYETDAPNLAAIDQGIARHVITTENWREHLGNKKYTAAYVDFFDAEVAKNKGNWEKVVCEYLYSGTEKLVHGFCGGLGHPFIHLAYGYEFQSKEVITEALSLGCTEYDMTHKYFDTPPPNTSTYETTSLCEVMSRIGKDSRFDGYSANPGFANVFPLLDKYKSEVLEHWSALKVENTITQLKDWLKTAVILAVSTSNACEGFDFYLAHILTVGHALRILLPHIPEEHRTTVMKQYAFFAILIYLIQLRPAFGHDLIVSSKYNGESWDDVYRRALQSKWSNDVHWPKVFRALRAVEELRGSEECFYLKAAVRFLDGFNDWTGFGLGHEAIPDY